MKKFISAFCCIVFSLTMYAQNGKITGRVVDDKGEALMGATIVIDASKGQAATADLDGNYELTIAAGTYDVTYHYINLTDTKIRVTVIENENVTQNVTLKQNARIIDEIVFTGSKFEKKLSEEVATLEVMKGSTLANQNITDLSSGVQKIPGVTIADGQANIRSGSGWSYGAGSRVAILYDDLPITTADADDAKWSVIPMENVEQVEVIKGAASSLYGSGALNGIINARTAWPTDKPFTKVTTYAGFYGAPPDRDMKWWLSGQQQYFTGINMADRRKVGQFDFITGLGITTDRGYLDSSDASDMHANFKIRWRSKKIEGLSLGINAVAYYSWGKTFFIWDSVGKKGYEPLPGTITIYHNGRYVIDPFINYYDKLDNRFTFRYRYLNSSNINTTGQGSIGHKNYAEFQYSRQFKKIALTFVSGIVGEYDLARAPKGSSDSASLIGNHDRGNIGIYAQIDKKFFDKLTVSVGGRWEYFNADKDTLNSVNNRYVVVGRTNSLTTLKYPLGRIGINYQITEGTYLRASGSMGFRYPSLAELYVHTFVGPLGVYSNPNLKPEKGYSAELGLKQAFKLGKNWMGYGDASFFANFYNNMMEFTFGQFGDPNSTKGLGGLGFSSQNIGNTRILGTEITAGLQGKVGKNFELGLIIGYTYTDPRALDWNKKLVMTNQFGDTIKTEATIQYNLNGTIFPVIARTSNDANHDPVTNPDSSTLTYAMTSSSKNNVLKYRSRHQFKVIFNVGYKKWDLNIDYQYLSYQENIDYAFVSSLFATQSSAFAGLKSYRDAQAAAGNKGTHVLNLSLGFKPTPKFKMAFIVKNVTNSEWMARPGQFQAPRNYTLQLSYTL
ncbi:MAG: TonB-dependent receptor [Bacteroidetes bacterium]|nr:TonB-dependent receptor [Bacteroidota bacterium]